MKLIIQYSVFLALLVFGIYLGNQNSQEIDVVFLGREFTDQPLWMVLLISFAVGAFASLIFCSFELFRAWGKIYSLKRQLRSHSREITAEVYNNGRPESPASVVSTVEGQSEGVPPGEPR